MSFKVKIADTEYPAAMRLLAVREYHKLTGRSLISDRALTDIFGGAGGEFNAELYCAFVWCILYNGGYSSETKKSDFTLTVDDVADGIKNVDGSALTVMRFYLMNKNDWSEERADEFFSTVAKKKMETISTPTNKDGELVGEESKPSPTGI